MESKAIYYDIHSYSSFSSSYLPENIRDDSPSNQISRWSSETNTPTQFITLKLSKPSIVKFIKFGKYEKPHVCNLKKFKVLGGMDLNSMSQMFEGGLKNDSVPETFELKYKTMSNENFPVLYISVIPLLSYGPSFNFSIWFIELIGIEDELIVSDTLRNYNEQKEKITIRLILKHLRDRGHLGSFKALSQETQIQLEDPEITDLYNCLLDDGNFDEVENIMKRLIENGNDEEYIARQKYKARFEEIMTNPDNKNRPSPRTNAAFSFDDTRRRLYMFGGFSEQNELDDFWMYDVAKNEWIMLENTSGISPSARAGSKMIYDEIGNQLFLIGRKSLKGYENFKSDFYLYDLTRNSWMLICDDTSLENGPHVISDHQICINQESRTIYVFGGKVADKPDDNSENFSDFYAYHINTNTWSKIFVDCSHPQAANPEILSIKSRVRSCMMYDNASKHIFIFGGHRGKEKFSDILKVDPQAKTITTVAITSLETDALNGPFSSFGNSLSTFDNKRAEIFVISPENVWVFSTSTSEWTMICKNPPYMCSQNEYVALDSTTGDFIIIKEGRMCKMELKKPSRENIISLCKYMIRKQRYEEIAIINPIEALSFLQNNLAETINQSDNEQVNDFHKLASLLFTNGNNNTSENDQDKFRHQRTCLFNKLIDLLPESKCQPRRNLCNFINI